jgi:hypothetical protein
LAGWLACMHACMHTCLVGHQGGTVQPAPTQPKPLAICFEAHIGWKSSSLDALSYPLR